MSKFRNIDFNHAIRYVMKKRHPNRRLDRKSTDLLNTILNHVSRELVDKFNAEYEASTYTEKLYFLYARKAVEKTFLGNLKKQAKAESARQLAMYDKGKLKREKKATRKRSSKANFQAWLSKMCPPGPSLDKDAENFLGGHLQQFVSVVVGSAHPEEFLQPYDLRSAMAHYLGPEVYRIACKEGIRALELHANGLINL